MNNSLTFHYADGQTVITGDSSVVDSGILVLPVDDSDSVIVRIKWGHGEDRPVWSYRLGWDDYRHVLADGITTGSLGHLANAVKREALRANSAFVPSWADYIGNVVAWAAREQRERLAS